MGFANFFSSFDTPVTGQCNRNEMKVREMLHVMDANGVASLKLVSRHAVPVIR